MEGNNTKTRAALEFAVHQLLEATESDKYGDDVVYLVGCMRTVAAACRAALSEPARQCDVGSADEQYARWRDYCDKHKCGPECPVFKLADVVESKARCSLVWAQMPYDAEREGEGDGR